MLDQHITNRVRIILHRIYLFVHCPPERLSQLSRDLTDSGDVLGAVSRIVSEHNTDEVLASQNLQVVENFFDELLLMLVMSFGRC